METLAPILAPGSIADVGWICMSGVELIAANIIPEGWTLNSNGAGE
jgi:hypothetical protein